MEKMIRYCENCHKEVEVKVTKEFVKYTIANSGIDVECEIPRCLECNNEVSDSELFERNSKKAKEKYIKDFKILSIDEIKDLLIKYEIGATVLSKVLNWGDVTITRYLKGKLPSKTYSDKLREINENPCLLLELLEQNKLNISELAYEKCKNKILSINELAISKEYDSATAKIHDVAKYILSKVELTPLALQKSLYFIQGFSIAFNDIFMFDDIPKAWVHGPVYPQIYHDYKEFGYNPIEKNIECNVEIGDSDKSLIDNVIKYLSLYNGTILEKITHIEMPWVNARQGLNEKDKSSNPMQLNDIEEYFRRVKEKYNMITYLDIRDYANDMISKVM